MVSTFYDPSAPRFNNGKPLPFDQLPHGFLEPPLAIREEVARQRALHQPYYDDTYAKLILDDWTLAYYFEGMDVVYRSVPGGVEVFAVGDEEIGKFYQTAPPELQEDVIVKDC